MRGLPLIGLIGYKRSGKSELAKAMVWKGWQEQSVSDLIILDLYFVAFRNMGWGTLEDFATYLRTEQEADSERWRNWGRPLLQSWGYMRRDQCGADYWIRRLHLIPGQVISNVRYQNEADAIRAKGGYIFRVVRRGYGSDGHVSESADRIVADGVIANNGTLGELHDCADWLARADLSRAETKGVIYHASEE